MPGSPTFVANIGACSTLCDDTEGCTSTVYFPNGACFLKSVPFNDIVPLPRQGMTSRIHCPCNTWLAETDIPGPNLAAGGSFVANMDECIAKCGVTDGCSAVVYFPNGWCIAKKGDASSDIPIVREGMSLYLTCSETFRCDSGDPEGFLQCPETGRPPFQCACALKSSEQDCARDCT